MTRNSHFLFGMALDSRSLVAALLIGIAPASLSWAQSIDVTTATLEQVNQALDEGTLTSERLVALYLERIEAFDQRGPMLNAVITLNPKALTRARELDIERRAHGARSPLHGIPIVLKDNLDTADMPTTAGS
ncbi:MAG TPA: amidase, partial [Gemmatimonadetes bacterium]|nr:amidase [Gemmatimonadota bacterium]